MKRVIRLFGALTWAGIFAWPASAVEWQWSVAVDSVNSHAQVHLPVPPLDGSLTFKLTGNFLDAVGYGAFVVELDSGGNIVRKFGGKGQVPDQVRPFFYAMMQLLPNGNVVLANWQGHGPGFGSSGVQLLEFNGAGEIVWSWRQADLISSLQGVLVLDGLDKTPR